VLSSAFLLFEAVQRTTIENQSIAMSIYDYYGQIDSFIYFTLKMAKCYREWNISVRNESGKWIGCKDKIWWQSL